MTEYIGFKDTGCDIEFSFHSKSDKAYRVKTEDGYLIWIPKFCFNEDGSMKRKYNDIFYDNIKKAVSNYRGNL